MLFMYLLCIEMIVIKNLNKKIPNSKKLKMNDRDLEIHGRIDDRKTLSPLGWVILITSLSFLTLLISVIVCIIQMFLKARKRRQRHHKSPDGLVPLPLSQSVYS